MFRLLLLLNPSFWQATHTTTTITTRNLAAQCCQGEVVLPHKFKGQMWIDKQSVIWMLGVWIEQMSESVVEHVAIRGNVARSTRPRTRSSKSSVLATGPRSVVLVQAWQRLRLGGGADEVERGGHRRERHHQQPLRMSITQSPHAPNESERNFGSANGYTQTLSSR
jgi:hypothetical protein